MRHILKKDPSCAWRFVRFAKNVMGPSGEHETALAAAGIDALEAYCWLNGDIGFVTNAP